MQVAKLSRNLNVSKSGFYWHFKDRDQLLEEMKTEWVSKYSRKIISDVLDLKPPLRARLEGLVHQIRNSESGKYDLAFVAWAKTDPAVRELVDQVRDMRVAFVRRLLSSKFDQDHELEARARLFVVYFSWSEVMFRPADEAIEDEPLDTILSIIAGTA